MMLTKVSAYSLDLGMVCNSPRVEWVGETIMGFFINLWLRRQPLWLQCVVFALFVVVGAPFVWAGAVTGNGREMASGVVIALAWPLQMFVVRPFYLRLQRLLYGAPSQ